MIVIALLVIVVSLVGPSMRQLLAVQRVQSINAELVADLQFARSEAVRRGQPLFVKFQSTSDMTCYVVYTEAGVGNCNCTKAPGSACLGGFQEVKTVQVPRKLDVSFAASSSIGTLVSFTDIAGTSQPGDFQVDVTSTVRGLLRTSVNAAGRPAVCSPDGSISQVPKCAS
jgi:type IV fimbrial biogenesis protein FimT